MPGNPKECRKHAARCAQLATEAQTEQLKAHFVMLSRAWEKLAKDIEHIPELAMEAFAIPRRQASAGSPNPPAPSPRRRSPTNGRKPPLPLQE
jgi:hypothetical protein